MVIRAKETPQPLRLDYMNPSLSEARKACPLCFQRFKEGDMVSVVSLTSPVHDEAERVLIHHRCYTPPKRKKKLTEDY